LREACSRAYDHYENESNTKEKEIVTTAHHTSIKINTKKRLKRRRPKRRKAR
jgi:hypothetical protein